MQPVLSIVLVIGIVVWHNALHLAPPRLREPVVSIGVTAAAVAGGVWLFSSVDPTRGLAAAVPWTLATAGLCLGVVAVSRVVPTVAGWLTDQRMAAMGSSEFLVHTLVRIPMFTALTEEVLFRGVVWALLARMGGDVVALVGSSVAFGFGHVVVARDQARREGHDELRWIAVTVVATGLAGLFLGWLRLRTGGIWAPVGVHAAVNMVLAFGARIATPTPEPADP
ncbi:CPBP family intramembrane glutamic endopeptidase [Salsipaludibacter albus]|uniref:CPBP family intramembrane glutamic endopeptidase n=1 Tax=Salsipaludibacter albus TaxID=2849650 RepID=UPI001EE3C625|nr:CPBP family intramembrane metalloprotease [Salsipaludibacter albus]